MKQLKSFLIGFYFQYCTTAETTVRSTQATSFTTPGSLSKKNQFNHNLAYKFYHVIKLLILLNTRQDENAMNRAAQQID